MGQSPLLPWSGIPAAGVALRGQDPTAPDVPETPPPGGLTAHASIMADDLRRRYGVQNFTNAETRVYGYHAATKSRIVDLGVGYWRGMLLGNNGDNEWGAFCRANDLGWLMTTTPESGISTAALQAKILHLKNNNADVCIGVEGMNEPNQERSGAPAPATWAADCVDALRVLYEAMKSYPQTENIPILLPSLHDTNSKNSYVTQRSLLWTRQTTDLTYSNGRWTATTPVAGTTLMTSGYITAPTTPAGAWAGKAFGGYTGIRGTGVRIQLEAWSSSSRLAVLGSLTLTSTATTAPVRDWPIENTPAGTTRIRVVLVATGGADAVIVLGGTTTATTTQTNTLTLGFAPKPDGGFRHFHQMAAQGAAQYVDAAGMHRYTSGATIDTDWPTRAGNMLDAFPGMPQWLTEIGWQDAMDLPLSSGFRPTPQAIGGEYAARSIFTVCSPNEYDAKASYYELMDDPDISGVEVQSHFGLYNVGVGVPQSPTDTYNARALAADPETTWTPKPAATMLKDQLTWLKDAPGRGGTPGTAYYNLTNTPTLLRTQPVTFSASHPTRAGEKWLVYYRNTRRYNTSTRTVIADEPASFTLTDGQGSRTLTATGVPQRVKIRA